MSNHFQSDNAQRTNNLRFDGLIVGTTDYQQNSMKEDWHFHENPTICFLLQGGCVERRNRNNYERFACDLRFYHAEELHQSIIRVFPSKCVNLQLESEFSDRYGISESILNSSITNNLDAKLLMLKIQSELKTNDDFTKSSIKILLLGLIKDTKNSNNHKRPDWIITLYELLNDRWSEKLSLEDLSLAVNIHPTTISKYFSKYFFCTLGEYMRKLRIVKSISLIRNTKIPLTEIALGCGFADQSHFTRNFKKLTGFLPKDFKRL